MKLIQKLRLWYYTRKQIMDEVQSLTEMLDIQMSKYIPQIEALEQHKIYLICDEDATQEKTEALQCILQTFNKKIKWTLPPIIIINKKIKQMTKEELGIIAKAIGANRVQTHNK